MHVFLIDDSVSALAALTKAIAEVVDCGISSFSDPTDALHRLEEYAPDLVLVDYEMPSKNGIEVIKTIRSNPHTASVPVIMLTSVRDRAIKLAAIEAGATEFLNKPFDELELGTRVRNLLSIRAEQLALRRKAMRLKAQYQQATERLDRREEEIIWRLSRAIDARDGDTGGHIDRVSVVARMIAEQLGLSEKMCRMIFLASPLHDVGKLGVRDEILLKPGKLSAEEFQEMQKHTLIGAEILSNSASELIRTAEIIAANHHEKWDGTGYPRGLKGPEIPIEARIVAIADVLDALCSVRPYKKAWPVDAAFAEITNNSGKHFDPACVAAFCRCWPEIRDRFVSALSEKEDETAPTTFGKTA